ncbi:MAG: ABC transporter substrate-binding protein [Microbacterium sp.]|jgi:peptide/nickel transport system substrate-binding protein|nr:ABC transporter substrate-binding protein [Microbacterium sp.]
MTRTRTARAVAAGVAVLLSVGALAACSPAGSDAGKDDKNLDWKLTTDTAAPKGDIDEIKWANYSEPYSLDYAYAFDYSDNQVLANVCESLLRLNPDFTLTPSLATSFENPTPLTWVYTIRDGVTFHDGTTLTADDVVASMSRHLDPAVGSSWFSVYQNVDLIKKTAANQVTVTTKIPDSQFNLGMGGSAGVVESAKTLAAKGEDYGNSTGGVNCTGPFSLTEWKSGESITLTRYDKYWNKDLMAKSKKFEFVFMGDSTARVNALKSGSVDGSWQIPIEAVPTLRASGKGDALFAPSTAVGDIVISNLKGPLGDVRVRKALLMAIDREGMLTAAARGVGDVTDVLTTKTVWGDASEAAVKTAFGDITHYDHDVEAAKKLIKDAGVEGETLTYVTAPIGNDFTVISQAVSAAAQSIGLKVKVNTVSPSAYTALFSDPSAREGVDMFYTSWYLSSPDALEMYGVLRTGDFSNYGNWSDPEYDKIVTEAVQTFDPKKRSELTAKLQQITNEELPWLPLFEGPIPLFMGERVTGMQPSMAFLYYPWAATLGAR